MRFSVVFVLLTGLAFGSDYGAGELWQKFKNKAGTKEGIRESFQKPLTGGSPMTDISGTTSFGATIRCASAEKGIEVVFIPLGGGDYGLLVRQDLNLDGSFEYVYETTSEGVRVSGVCRAGVVSCDPGSWRNCEYYFWDVSPDGYVKLVRTNDTSLLGGCICTNSSCGVDVLARETVDYVAGGIAQAVMRARKDLGVFRDKFDPGSFTLSFRVQKKDQGCYQGGYGETDISELASYYENQTEPPSMDYVLTNPEVQNNPDSPYYLVSRASEVEIGKGKIGVPRRVSCDVRKDVAVYTTDMYENCSETWVDPNGEVWCVVDKRTYKRTANHCGGNTCDDCFEPSLQADGWYVCGEIIEECFNFDEDCTYTYNCNDEWCRKLFKYRKYLREGRVVRTETLETLTVNYRELLCPRPVFLTVTLKRNQKYGVLFWASGNAGSTDGYWDIAVVTENGYNFVSLSKKGTCNPFEQFFPLGVAEKEGETHTAGGIHAAQSWNTNCDILGCWSNFYPPSKMRISILKSQVYKGDTVSLSETNTCPSDEGCVIKNEWICDNTGKNCVQTIREGARTGILPEPFCYTTSTQIATYTVCAYGDRIEVRGNPGTYDRTFTGEEMWFWIKREYECPSEEIEIDLSRHSAVVGSTSYSSGEILYTDFYCEGGVCRPVRRDTIRAGEPDSCPAAVCTVRVREEDTSVFADRTNRSQTPGGKETAPYEVRSCERKAGSWVCPVKEGETLVEDCRCEQGLDSVGFSTSITILQSVVDASKDIICSTVSP